MERRSGLGFGFFHKAKTRVNNKRSEKQMAEMQAKIAIRGSIQHVWGDEGYPASLRSPKEVGVDTVVEFRQRRAQTAPSTESEHLRVESLHFAESSPSNVSSETTIGGCDTSVVPDMISTPAILELAPPLVREDEDANNPGQVLPRQEELSSPVIVVRNEPSQVLLDTAENSDGLGLSFTQRRRSSVASSLLSDRAFTADAISAQSVHKKFSFCPSTISLVQPRSPSMKTARSPRPSSLGGSSPYRRSTPIFSASTPSILQSDESTTFKGTRNLSSDFTSDRHVSIVDHDEDNIPTSPSNSVRYSTSIISHQSGDLYGSQQDLPGQIYSQVPADNLRNYPGIDASMPSHYDEDDDNSSLSGLSEVNAGLSELSDAEEGESDEEFAAQPGKHLINESGINQNLRRSSVLKRVSYTQLDNGEYLVEHRARSSKTSQRSSLLRRLSLQATEESGCTNGSSKEERRLSELARHQSVRSDDSGWSVEREIRGGI